MREFNRWIQPHVLGREKARPVCSLSIASSSTSEPQVTDSRGAARWGKMDDSFSNTSSRERKVLRRRFSQNVHFKIPYTASRACENPKHLTHLLCGSSLAINQAHGGWQQRYSMALHREENKFPLYAVAEVQMENPCPRSYIGPEKSQQKKSQQYGHFVKAEKSEE